MIRLLVCVAASLAIAANESAGQVSFRTVVLTGGQAPGLPAGVILSRIESLQVPLNSSGRIAFVGGLNGPGVTGFTNTAVFRDGHASGLELVARRGDQALGLPAGMTHYSFQANYLEISHAGHVSFKALLEGGPIVSELTSALVSESYGEGLRSVARSEAPVPGLPANIRFDALGTLLTNSTNQSAFYASLQGPGVNDANNGAVFQLSSESDFTILAREADQAPGFAAGVTLQRIEPEVLDHNDLQQVLLVSNLAGPGIDSSNNRALFVGSERANLAAVAVKGSQAPGLPADVNYLSFLYPQINDIGQPAFTATLTGANVTAETSAALFAPNAAGQLTSVARSGEQAPGLSNGVALSNFNSPSLNDHGQVTFTALLSGDGVDESNDRAVYIADPTDGIRSIAREGDAAYGFLSDVAYSSLGSTAINNRGQIAFRARLAGANISTINDDAFYATDLLGNLQLVVAEGQLFYVNSDPLVEDLRTISQLTIGNGFNDAGELPFRAHFTNGTTGLFVAMVSVPEPSTVVLLTIACLLTTRQPTTAC